MMTRLHLTLLVVLILVSFCFGVSFSVLRWLSRDLPPVAALEKVEPSTISKVYDLNGNVIYEFYEERRTPIAVSKVPNDLINALESVEDRRFRSHWGVDILRVAKAMFMNLKSGRIVQGASTITQQLARNLFLTPRVSWVRKLKEAILAVQIERLYSKDEIMELYLNQIYFGNGVYGVESASQLYFHKSVEELTLAESSMLVALAKAPSRYSPYANPEALTRRMNLVLDAMVDNRKATRSEAEEIKQTAVVVNPRGLRPNEAPYFVEEVRQEVEARFGSQSLYRDGLQIYTTLDLDLQRIANGALEDWLQILENEYEYEHTFADYDPDSASSSVIPYLEGALLAVEARTGYVKAMIGGRDFSHSQFNRAVQAWRQAGSAFKPFVYTAAMDNGFTPSYQVLDAPIVVEAGDTIWRPSNYDERFLGLTNLRRGLALSRNLVAVRLIRLVNPRTVIDYARRMGVGGSMKNVLSLALGSCEVTLLGMVTGYSTLANGGLKVRPLSILKVLDSEGRILYRGEHHEEQVLSHQTAYIMTNMLESVLNNGTAIGARLRGFRAPAAGKTGTTNDFTDAWFVGYSPDLVCGVWVGFDEKRSIGDDASGARAALPIWDRFMREALGERPHRSFTEPPGIVRAEICATSGLLATAGCPELKEEVFIAGTEPQDTCTIHEFTLEREGGVRDFEDLDREFFEEEGLYD
jgi:penicillin-binding protein 1A